MQRRFSQACENNKEPILTLLRGLFADSRDVLEIGSGTGQHAVHFAANLPHLIWQTSDRRENHDSIAAWLTEANLSNAMPPLTLDVDETPWPLDATGAVFSANTAHIMGWSSVVNMFTGVARILTPGAPFVLYGPFAYSGRHTAQSNARFDASLRSQDPQMGIRDMDDLLALGREQGLALASDNPMPANNRLLVWCRD